MLLMMKIFPLEVTLTPDSDLIDLDLDFEVPFNDFKRACLSDGVTSSDPLFMTEASFLHSL